MAVDYRRNPAVLRPSYRASPHLISRTTPPGLRRQPATPSLWTGASWRTFRILGLFILLIAFGWHILYAKHAAAEAAQTLAAQTQLEQKTAIFAGQIRNLISNNPATSFSIATATTSDGIKQYGNSTVFDGASTAKLLTAADYLQHVQSGRASLGQVLDGHTGGYWLRIMLVNSDDTAWTILNNYLTHDDLRHYATSIGFTNYNPEVNTFTAEDVALLLQRLYDGSLLQPKQRNMLLYYLSQANYRDYIVAAVPRGDKVYHKTGIDSDFVNDAAVMQHGQQWLVLVIFTNGHNTYNWSQRAEQMHTITRAAAAAYL